MNQKEYHLDRAFTLSDSLLESGLYYFRVEAFDKENSFSAFRYISIQGITKRKTGVFVSCENSGSTDLYLDANDLNFSLKNSFNANYQASRFNSTDQHFWFIPSNSKQLDVYNPVTNTIEYSKTYVSNFSSAFSGLERDKRDVVLALRKGEVDGFNQAFSGNYTYLSQSDRKIENLAINGTYVLIEELDRTGTNRTLKVLRRSSGAVKSSPAFNHDIEKMVFLDEEHCLVFYNTSQGGSAVIFDIDIGSFNNALFSTDSILGAVRANNGDFIISTKSGVETYSAQSNSLVGYLNLPNAVLAYDKLNNQLYVGSGRNLRSYTYRQGSGTRTLLPDEIVGINIRYNINLD